MRRRGPDFRRPVRRRFSNVFWLTACGLTVLLLIVLLSRESQPTSRSVLSKRNLVSATDSITKLRRFVLQKKLQLMKQKLEMKLNFIARSQIKLLEAWGDLERQHLAAVSTTKDALHSVVCRVPLIEGAKVEPQSASIALRHASDLTASIKSMLSTFSPTAEEAVLLLSELAEVATQEKSLLEECLEYFRALSTLEMQEWSLKCTIMQIQLAQQQQQQQKLEIPA